jgi:hypothetical protein
MAISGAQARIPGAGHPHERLVRYSDAVAQTTPRNPAGKQSGPTGKYPAKPPTKKQRRNQMAARSVSLERKPPWQSPTVVTISSVAIVAVVLIIIVLINQVGGNNATVATTVPQAILTAVENPSSTVVDTIGTGGQSGELTRLPASAVLPEVDGKPMVVFVGAEDCVMVMWLSRFGTFTNLHEIESSSTDVYADTNTFTFYKASYSSQYIDFSPNEIEDRNEQPLQTMSAQVSKIFTTWDQPPYTVQAQGFPFVDIGGLFTLYNSSYSPGDLANLSWKQIADDLSNPTSTVAKDIIGNANILTAATCMATGDTPSSVCSSSTIQSIESVVKTIKTPS